MTPNSIFERYQSVTGRLPKFPKVAQSGSTLTSASRFDEVAEQFGVFFFDAFGVLNVGEGALASAVDRLAALQRAGKQVYILTNSASYTKAHQVTKFQRLGFDVNADSIISSRDVLLSNLSAQLLEFDQQGLQIGCIHACDLEDLPAAAQRRVSSANGCDHGIQVSSVDFWHADLYLFLSSARWSDPAQSALIAHLQRTPKPVWVGNPDLVAPRERHFSLEPGYFAHAIADQTDSQVTFFGKPFTNTFDYAFNVARQRNPQLQRHEILMVGDTLHTDILGGLAAGMRTALVTDFGSFAGTDVRPYITKSGIVPDYIVPSL